MVASQSDFFVTGGTRRRRGLHQSEVFKERSRFPSIFIPPDKMFIFILYGTYGPQQHTTKITATRLPGLAKKCCPRLSLAEPKFAFRGVFGVFFSAPLSARRLRHLGLTCASPIDTNENIDQKSETRNVPKQLLRRHMEGIFLREKSSIREKSISTEGWAGARRKVGIIILRKTTMQSLSAAKHQTIAINRRRDVIASVCS